MITNRIYEMIKSGDFFVTSDTHFGHKNIIKYCDRPFTDTDEMDEVMIERFNKKNSESLPLVHLGDVAMGDISKSLPKVGRLNGYKILITGNHDRTFSKMGRDKIKQWLPKYEELFDHTISDFGTIFEINGNLTRFSHFPYTGDHTPDDRHSDVRPVDDGMLLIHGHTHSTERASLSSRGTQQFHVGVDAWDFEPVHWSEILNEMELY